MRYILLALALVFGLGNTDEKVEALLDNDDYAGAFNVAKAAASAGDAQGHDWLGWFYETGKGAPLDMGLAESHYRSAADGGDEHANWRLGVLIDMGKIGGTPEEAVQRFQAGAARNHPDSIVSLAVMHATGRGTPKDSMKAFETYMRAARLKDGGGIRGVGIMYYLGEAVKPDLKEAMAWFLLSAALGNEDGEASMELVAEQNPDIDFEAVAERAGAIAAELGIE